MELPLTNSVDAFIPIKCPSEHSKHTSVQEYGHNFLGQGSDQRLAAWLFRGYGMIIPGFWTRVQKSIVCSAWEISNGAPDNNKRRTSDERFKICLFGRQFREQQILIHAIFAPPRQDSEYIKVVIKIVTLDPMPVVISKKFFINVETEYSNSIWQYE